MILTSCEAAVVTKPKARLCEPWETILPKSAEPAKRATLFEYDDSRRFAAPQFCFLQVTPRLAKPRLGLSYNRCFAAG